MLSKHFAVSDAVSAGSAPSASVPRVVAIVGATVLSTLLVQLLLASDFDIAMVRTIVTRDVGEGGAVIQMRYNPVAILAVALLVAGATALVAKVAVRFGLLPASAGTADAALQAARAENIDKQLAKIMALVRAHLQSNSGYAKSLSGARTKLESLPQSEQLGVVLSFLVDETDRMRRETAALAQQLNQSSQELEALKSDIGRTVEVAMTDALTGIGNRRRFEADLEKARDAAKGAGEPVSVVMCDIDHFKRVNDTFGHRVGDEVLRMFARTLEGSLRDGDTIARYGGEEFVIVLPSTRAGGAQQIAERVRAQFASKRLKVRETNQDVGVITASFGVVEIRPGESSADAVERADRKLYEAKARGRNKVL